jgi:hypothetical protein
LNISHSKPSKNAKCERKVTGRVDVEELLDVIFRDFCIGKKDVSMSDINGNNRKPLSFKGSKVGANEAERSSLVFLYWIIIHQ